MVPITAVYVKRLDGIGTRVLVVLDDDRLSDIDHLHQLDGTVPYLDQAFFATSDDITIVTRQLVGYLYAVYSGNMGILI